MCDNALVEPLTAATVCHSGNAHMVGRHQGRRAAVKRACLREHAFDTVLSFVGGTNQVTKIKEQIRGRLTSFIRQESCMIQILCACVLSYLIK
jgi:hypothetical protein